MLSLKCVESALCHFCVIDPIFPCLMLRLYTLNRLRLLELSCNGGGGLGGWVFSQVGGSKALDPPPPLIIPRVSWVGLQPPLLSLVTGALSGWLLVPLSALLLCRNHAKREKKCFHPMCLCSIYSEF